MKLKKTLYAALLAGFALVSCTNTEDLMPEGGTVLAEQVREINEIEPSRAEASFNGMFTMLGRPCRLYSYTDDMGIISLLLCNDFEGSDAVMIDSGYNWFSVCGEYSSRSKTYRNPAIRYRVPYTLIGDVNTFVSGYAEDVTDENALNMIAQARVIRAYCYSLLAPQYQYSPAAGALDEPCVPLVTEHTTDYTNNPRATVREIYDYILEDLDYAIETFEASTITRMAKNYIDASVAYALRARVNLTLQNWQAAYDDAVKAAEGYTPASIAEVSVPSFMDISEHNWIWGYDMQADIAAIFRYATTSGWLRSFSAWSYTCGVQCYAMINQMLWSMIPETDVRKGWWVDENLESPLIEGLTWPNITSGPTDVANATNGDKMAYLPYTNVKFGCNTIGTTTNDEDMPFIRVEEMILIQAEALANLGQTQEATTVLTNFVTTYRDPSYNVSGRGLPLLDEIWFQRRIELWGEGFGVFDNLRLNKPIVRFLGTAESTNHPDAFRFNLAADDPWLLMRFPQGETNTNFGVVDNTGGHQPVIDEGADLRDGVTDNATL